MGLRGVLSTWRHFTWAFKTGWSIDKQRFRARGISRARGRATQVWRVRGMRWSGKRPAYLVWLSKRWGWLRWRWQRGKVGSGALDRNQAWLLVCETEMWLGGVAINGVRDSWNKGRFSCAGRREGEVSWPGLASPLRCLLTSSDCSSWLSAALSVSLLQRY